MASAVSFLLVSFALSLGTTTAVIGAPWCDFEINYLGYYSVCTGIDPRTYTCACRNPQSVCAVQTNSTPFARCFNSSVSPLFKILKNFTAATVNNCCDRKIDAGTYAVTTSNVNLTQGVNKLPNGTTLYLTCKPGYFMADKSGQLCSDNCAQFQSPQSTPYCTVSGSLSATGWKYLWNDTASPVYCLLFRDVYEQCGTNIVTTSPPYIPTGISMCKTSLNCSNGMCTLKLGSTCYASDPCPSDAVCMNGICTQCSNCCTLRKSHWFVRNATSANAVYAATAVAFSQATAISVQCAPGYYVIDGSTSVKYNVTMAAKCGYINGNATWINVVSSAKISTSVPPNCTWQQDVTGNPYNYDYY